MREFQGSFDSDVVDAGGKDFLKVIGAHGFQGMGAAG
jgi:hypothetical protein